MSKEDVLESVEILNEIIGSEMYKRMTGAVKVPLGIDNLLNTHNHSYRILKTAELKIDKYSGLVECVDTNHISFPTLNLNHNNFDNNLQPPGSSRIVPMEEFENIVMQYGLKSESLAKARDYILNGAR
jgi:hypothetical protein